MYARKEVVLSAGAVNTPQLLLLSGVGPARELQSHGIDSVLDSPAVGRNLQDHYGIDHMYRSTRPTLNNRLHPWPGKLWAAMQYVFARRGPLARNINHAGGFVRTRPELDSTLATSDQILLWTLLLVNVGWRATKLFSR